MIIKMIMKYIVLNIEDIFLLNLFYGIIFERLLIIGDSVIKVSVIVLFVIDINNSCLKGILNIVYWGLVCCWYVWVWFLLFNFLVFWFIWLFMCFWIDCNFCLIILFCFFEIVFNFMLLFGVLIMSLMLLIIWLINFWDVFVDCMWLIFSFFCFLLKILVVNIKWFFLI